MAMSRFEVGSKWATQGERYFQVDVVDSATREMVATTHGHTQEEAEAIARRIASAVNSHDELLAACKAVIAFLDRLEDCDTEDPLWELRRRIHKPLRDKLEPAITHAEARDA